MRWMKLMPVLLIASCAVGCIEELGDVAVLAGLLAILQELLASLPAI